MQDYEPENICTNTLLAKQVARIVYAETLATSLRVVEALTSMINNLCYKTNRCIESIISDENIFESLNNTSARHEYLTPDENSKKFHMCLRVAIRMLRGNLQDMCWGATNFHREEFLPSWAVARGYILSVDGLSFYL